MLEKKSGIICMIAFLFCLPGAESCNKQKGMKGHLTLSGAFALYPMAVKWAEEYNKVYPDLKIDISAGGAGKGMTDVLNNMVDIGMVSREVYPEEIKKGAFPVAVTKDAVVPVINASNPAIQELLLKGLKKSTAEDLWLYGRNKNWAQAFEVGQDHPIHVYTRSDACGAAEMWARYLGHKQEDLLGDGVFGDPGLALAVKKDPYGIGYNNIGYAYDSKTRKQLDGIRILPLDLNENGKTDKEEDFYNDMDELIQAVSSGNYPSPPARDLYFVTLGNTVKPEVNAFLQWVLTEGQQFVHEAGYIQLQPERLKKELEKLEQH